MFFMFRAVPRKRAVCGYRLCASHFDADISVECVCGGMYYVLYDTMYLVSCDTW